MTSSVAIQFAMNTRKVPSDIIRDAEERHTKRAKEQLRAFQQEKYKDMMNVILEGLPSINGLPISAFLSRMRGVIPLGRHSSAHLNRFLNEQLKILQNTSQDSSVGTKVTHEQKIQAVRNLCRAAVDQRDQEIFSLWLGSNVGALNEAFANCFGTEHRDLTQEACFAAAYLARTFRFQMYDKLDLVIAALVRALAMTLIPWESYVEHYRDAKERHSDLEVARGRPMPFHHPRMEYQFSEVNHRVLGCIYYTLGDLLFSCPTPKLIHFFECRIFRRREMTRNLLFTILHVVIVNLTELQTEAESLSAMSKNISSLSMHITSGVSPLTSRRGKFYSESMWKELPANLYSDIIRVYNDRNRANKALINEIMALLRAYAPEKLPIFEEATLKALELYTGSGGGRLTETYQIGRPTTSEGAGSASRRRKSVQTHDTSSGATASKPGSTHALSTVSVLGAATDMKGGISRLSKILTTLPPSDAQQVDKPTDKQSISTASSEDSCSSESNKQESKISRRTIVVPKLPDLLETNRIFQK